MGRSGALPRVFGQVAAKSRTPVKAMVVLMVIGLILIWSSSLMPTVSAVIAASVNAVAIQTCYYYGLAALVAAWTFRRSSRPIRWIGLCLFPALSGLSLIGLGLYAITTFNLVTKIVGLGGFALGILFYRPGRALEPDTALPSVAE
jgi:amino acid transporter